ncbi:MAG: type II toxin-antitoxin system VapC family toxin [Alphaproteobacteria bacterium]
MKVVLDSSVILSALLDDEQADYASLILSRLKRCDVYGVVPSLFFMESANALLMAHRRQRLNQETLILLLQTLSIMPLEREESPDLFQTTALAQKHSLTVYDATYLWVALNRGVLLASLDTALRKATLAEGIFYQP